ncbi:hypothetical protein KKF34_08435 [Myxococcota bacterium]|nr:hypothetical protein [Myxococcota bacterium]MBU1379679.1 hypothetical protein [Myxococcota bacterium]MBU1496890.1 hypothetical protein [Myxococcota bacterium]
MTKETHQNSSYSKWITVIFAVLTLLFSSNCVPINRSGVNFNKFPEITDTNERIKMFGFSFLPPQESGWRIAGKKDKAMVLVRETVAISHTFMAFSKIMEKKHYSKDPEKFLKQRVNEHLSEYRLAERYSDMRMRSKTIKFRGTDCIYISATVTDSGVRGFTGIYHDFNIDEILCYHKFDRKYLILFSYLERVPPGRTPHDSKSRIVKEMLRSIKFDKM